MVQNQIVVMCISLTSGYLTLQTKALLVLQPQQAYIRLLIESILSLFQGHSMYGGSLKHIY